MAIVRLKKTRDAGLRAVESKAKSYLKTGYICALVLLLWIVAQSTSEESPPLFMLALAWLLAAAGIIAFIMAIVTTLRERAQEKADELDEFRDAAKSGGVE